MMSCTIQQSDVAWEYDVEHLYGPVQPVNFNTEQLAASRGGNTSGTVLNKNEHFIVWMRPAAQPTFRKLWAVIDTPLPAGGPKLITPKRLSVPSHRRACLPEELLLNAINSVSGAGPMCLVS